LTLPRPPPNVCVAPNAGGRSPTGGRAPKLRRTSFVVSRAGLPEEGAQLHRARGREAWVVRVRPGLTARNRPRNVLKVAPETTERPSTVRARSLRTQQRAESQCQQPRPRVSGTVVRPCPHPWRIPLVHDEHTACRDQRSLRRHTGPSWTGPAAIHSIHGEFDPGSGRTLAACLTHASRARPFLREGVLAANG
jgi:hypothetical protein